MASTDPEEGPWALCLARADACRLAPLRLAPGVEVGEVGDVVWLRGERAAAGLRRLLAALPARDRFVWVLPSALCRVGSRIPAYRLPEIRWEPLASWLRVTAPASALPGRLPGTVRLALVESSEEAEPTMLETDPGALREFVRTAARLRMAGLQFAVSMEGRVLVRGRLLPPLPGRRWVGHGRVWVPAGYRWAPAVAVGVVEQVLRVAANEIVVWEPARSTGGSDGFVRLTTEQFVPLTPAAVRATFAELEVGR